MKWSTVTVGVMILGIIGVSIILLFQQLTTTNENDYYLLKEITEAAMIDSIDISYYRETGNLKIVREKFVENFTRRFAESTLIIGTKYTIKFFDVIEEPPKVSVRIDTGIENYKIYNTTDSYNVLNELTGIFEYVGKENKSSTTLLETNPYTIKTMTKSYYALVKKEASTKNYDKDLELTIPDELISGKISNQILTGVKFEKMEPDTITQGTVNEAVLQRDIYYNNADNDYGYFLPIANIEKNVYNDSSVKIYGGLARLNEKTDNKNKIQIKSVGTGTKDYAIIKFKATWQYSEYKYKIS